MSPATSDAEIARAIAFIERTEDLALLRSLLQSIRPRAARAVLNYERRRRPVPPPKSISAAEEPAGQMEALRIVRAIGDFDQLQAVSVVIGRRIEELMGRQAGA